MLTTPAILLFYSYVSVTDTVSNFYIIELMTVQPKIGGEQQVVASLLINIKGKLAVMALIFDVTNLQVCVRMCACMHPHKHTQARGFDNSSSYGVESNYVESICRATW